jgi:hypothetical protein
LVIAAVFATAALAVPAALADSPHFIKASASIDNAGNLVCTFKEAGLGTTVSTEAGHLLGGCKRRLRLHQRRQQPSEGVEQGNRCRASERRRQLPRPERFNDRKHHRRPTRTR